MQTILSFSTLADYAQELRGVAVRAELSKEQFAALLEIFDCYVEDHPHYHCRFRNDAKNEIIVCLDIEK